MTHLFFNSLFKSNTQLVLSTSVITFTLFFKKPIAPLNFSFVISYSFSSLIQQMKHYILPLCPQRELYVHHCISHSSHVICLIYMWKLNVCLFEQNSVLDPNNYKNGSATGKRQTSITFAFEEHTHVVQPAGDKPMASTLEFRRRAQKCKDKLTFQKNKLVREFLGTGGQLSRGCPKQIKQHNRNVIPFSAFTKL